MIPPVQGFMEYSYLFYGYYSSTVVDNSNFSYNIPLAYILTSVFYFTFCLICIIARSVPQFVLLYSCSTGTESLTRVKLVRYVEKGSPQRQV